MQELISSLSATELLIHFRDRTLSPVEVMRETIDRSGEYNPKINALFCERPEASMQLAAESEQRWFRGAPIGKLDGIPLAVKDSIAVAGMSYWRGVGANIGKPDPAYDSPPAARIKEHGAIIFAKTTMPDFGMLISGVSSAHGTTRNPWNLDFNTGGSSSGSGAAVAAGLCSIALGSDLGGSIRIPAALCGCVGMKPTHGRVPHTPPSLTRVAGPITRSVRDAALAMSVLVEPDLHDYMAAPPDTADYNASLNRELKGLRIGVLLSADRPGEGQISEEVVATVRAAGELFRRGGALVEEIEPPLKESMSHAFAVAFQPRFRSEFLSLPKEKRGLVLAPLQEHFNAAPEYSALEYYQALNLIEGARKTLIGKLDSFDYVLAPVLGTSHYPAEVIHPEAGMPLLTPLLNQTGQPASSLCGGFDSAGMPIGFQIIGRRFDDFGVLQMSFVYEQMREFAITWPEVANCPSTQRRKSNAPTP